MPHRDTELRRHPELTRVDPPLTPTHTKDRGSLQLHDKTTPLGTLLWSTSSGLIHVDGPYPLALAQTAKT